MKFFSSVFLPDASIVSEGWVEPPRGRLPAIGAQGKFRESFAFQDGELVLDGTAYGGRVLCSLWKENRIVTSTAFVSGAEPEDDPKLLEIFVDTTLSSPAIRELCAAADRPFREVLERQERPFCATVLIPLQSRVETDAILTWQLQWIGSHLSEIAE